MENSPPSSARRGQKRRRLSHADYTIACIFPLSLELVPMRAMLDDLHEPLSFQRAHNSYLLGRIGSHNVVLTTLPSIGNNDSGAVATQLQNDFPNVRFGLLIGIGGGIPGKSGHDDIHEDIRLGDVVVSASSGSSAPVVQFDRGKRLTGRFLQGGHLNKPSQFLASTINILRAKHQHEGSSIGALVSGMLNRNPRMVQNYGRPPPETDQLFKTEYEHNEADSCLSCDRTQLVQRPPRLHGSDQPAVHYGPIGSSNSVIKCAIERDRLRQMYGILCVEMEAAGLMDVMPALVIRGICDYSDSHKSKHWQGYAAATAAAYAKEFIQTIPSDSLTIPLQGCEPCNANVQISMSPTSFSEQESLLSKRDPTSSNALLETLLESLTFERMDARLRNISRALRQTCNWLFEHESFQKWSQDQATEQDRFLWIKGKPGSGKSTIMKTALDWTKRRRPRGIFLSYFFNARAQSDLEKSSLGLYRSLTHQLLQNVPQCAEHFLRMFATKVHQNNIDGWTETELQDFLASVVHKEHGHVINIFIDALDEGEETDVRQLVSFLEDLILDTSGLPFRICLSSRYYPSIAIRNAVPLHVEDQAGHQADVVTYVRARFNGAKDRNLEDITLKICEKSAGIFLWLHLVVPILNKVYDRGRHQDLLTCLDNIPKDLEDLFNNILARDTEELDECHLLLQWLLLAYKPLSETELYLAVCPDTFSESLGRDSIPSEADVRHYILNTSRGLVEVTKANPPVVQFIHETIRSFLIKNKTGHDSDVQSTKYQGKCHDRLRTACVDYIQRRGAAIEDNKSQAGGEHRQYEEAVSFQFPFLKYATSYLFEHANAAEASGTAQTVFLNQFDSDFHGLRASWVRAYNTFQNVQARRCSSAIPVSYLVAERGLVELVKVLINMLTISRVDVMTNERCGNALQAASAAGHKEVVRLLIDAGSDVNNFGGEWKCAILAAIRYKKETVIDMLSKAGANPPREALNSALYATVARGYLYGVKTLLQLDHLLCACKRRKEPLLYYAAVKGDIDIVRHIIDVIGSTADTAWSTAEALWMACENDNHQVIKLLLEQGADIHQLGGKYGTVLQAASVHGYQKVVKLLLDYGADVNQLGGLYGTALQAASYYGFRHVVELLLNHGADVTQEGGRCGTALQAASRQGHRPTVIMLLNHGADIDQSSGSNTTALQAASMWGHEQVVELLLAHGADFSQQDSYGNTALQVASTAGHGQVVKLLLNHGAELDHRNRNCRTALETASARGHGQVVKLLLNHGADVDRPNEDCSTALLDALMRGNVQMARLLLDHGADVNRLDGDGNTALQTASYYGIEQIVKLLVDHGADTNRVGGAFGTALQAASRENHLHIVNLLLDHGANVHQLSEYGTALRAASYGGNQDIVKLLLDRGADFDISSQARDTPIELARQQGNHEVVRVLEEHADKKRRQRQEDRDRLHRADQ